MLEVLAGDKTPGQIAKTYRMHANSVGLWNRPFIERATEIFAEETMVNEYEAVNLHELRNGVDAEHVAAATVADRRVGKLELPSHG